MNKIEYKEFKIGDLFSTVKRGKRLTIKDRIYGKIPLITAGFENTGISALIGNLEQEIFPANSITIDMFGNVFYRSYNYCADDNIISLDNPKLKKRVLLYIVVVVSKDLQGKYNYGRQFRLGDLEQLHINLPITNSGDPDFEYMETYIKQIEAKYVERVKDEYSSKHKLYLEATNLTNDEIEAIVNNKSLITPKFKEFKIGDLFDIQLSKGDNKLSDLSSGTVPLISAGQKNNGIIGYIQDGADGVAQKFPPYSLTSDMFGNTYLHPYDFYSVSHGRVNILTPKYNEIKNKRIGLFIVAKMKALTEIYSYSNMLTSKKLNNEIISLPVKPDGTPDYEYMEKYIQSIELLQIHKIFMYLEQNYS